MNRSYYHPWKQMRQAVDDLASAPGNLHARLKLARQEMAHIQLGSFDDPQLRRTFDEIFGVFDAHDMEINGHYLMGHMPGRTKSKLAKMIVDFAWQIESRYCWDL